MSDSCCLVCGLIGGSIDLPRGQIYSTEHWTVEHAVGPPGRGNGHPQANPSLSLLVGSKHGGVRNWVPHAPRLRDDQESVGTRSAH
jgi:hypothetical protein